MEPTIVIKHNENVKFYFIELFVNYTNEIKELAKQKHSYVFK